ncbi:MAG TPA: mycofactocin-coupled SDR family oxidoreductase [Aestuariivirgaceae bacterium]|nr:mycofactocin-coupled SDR family oxidoreductase [Aestuariivirgaceae bacterium]
MGRLDGKVALVTGAARGQGRAHALTLAGAGADIVAIDICKQIDTVGYKLADADDLAETVAAVEGLGRRAISGNVDVRSQPDLDTIVTRGIDELGQVDILIANAGIFGVGRFWEFTEAEWSNIQDVNLGGVWRSTKAVVPHMMARGSGAIVMTASVAGLEAAPMYAHYTAAKHGVLGLMQSVALELAPYGVRCNAICPGTIDTPMVNWPGTYDLFAGNDNGSRDDLIAGSKHFHALAGKDVLSPQAIADAALFLVSEDAASVTGVALPVDAGHLLLPGFNHEPA